MWYSKNVRSGILKSGSEKFRNSNIAKMRGLSSCVEESDNKFAQYRWDDIEDVSTPEHRTPVRAKEKRVVPKRNVVVSSDDESEEKWLDKRNPSQMTSSELELNRLSAISSRNKINLIPKKQKLSSYNEQLSTDSPEIAYADPGSLDNKVKRIDADKRMKETISRIKQKNGGLREQRANKRQEDKGMEQFRVRKRLRVIESDEDSASTSSTNIDTAENFVEELDEVFEVDENDEDDCNNHEFLRKQAKCEALLQKCSKYSDFLKLELENWQKKSFDESIEDNCLSITQIDDSYLDCDIKSIQNYDQEINASDNDGCKSFSRSLLKANDLSSCCPDLVLKDYQLVGVNWLRLLHEGHMNGVLADDMGLGKTIQTIAFLSWLQYCSKSRIIKPHLVIVPASTLNNWKNEFQKFSPFLSIVCYHGSQNERHIIRKNIKKLIEKNEVNVILTTYTMFERESGSDDRKFISKLDINYLILDEAHCLKNAATSRYSNLRSIQSTRRLLLSGTPVQNDIKELLSLLSFLMPALFTTDVLGVLHESCELSSTKDSTTNENYLSDGIKRIRRILAPFVLRRVKKDVLGQLPEKKTLVIRLTPTQTQQSLYDSVIQYHVQRRKDSAMPNSITTNSTTDAADPPSGDLSRTLTTSEANSIFTALRKAANHPLLSRVHYSSPETLKLISTVCYATQYFGDQSDFERVYEEILTFSDFDLNRLCIDFPIQLGHLQLQEDVLYESCKLNYMKVLLPQLVSENHRILIFSQWTRMMDIIEVLLNDLQLNFLRLDGTTPVKERQEMIDKFESDPTINIFILSTKAGGLGINLVAADTVIMHDLDFNPENDRQAEDRCHRIGQSRLVTVYKLVAEGTVDEDIFDMGERKQKFSKAVLSKEDTMTQQIEYILQKALRKK